MLEKYIALVKGQVDYYTGLVDRFTPDNPRYRPDQVKMYVRLLNEHHELLKYLEGQAKAAPQAGLFDGMTQDEIDAPPPAVKEPPTKPDDLSDLPPELLEQLSGRAKKAQTDELVQIISARGGAASIDEILIDLYRKTGKIETRIILSNRLHRLAKQGLIAPTEGRKGIYTTSP
jgi:hypothetical protein